MRLLLALIAITMAASAGTAKRVAGQGAVKSVYDDWQLRCDTLPGAQHEQCALMQKS
jgi:invasion protein IalB